MVGQNCPTQILLYVKVLALSHNLLNCSIHKNRDNTANYRVFAVDLHDYMAANYRVFVVDLHDYMAVQEWAVQSQLLPIITREHYISYH